MWIACRSFYGHFIRSTGRLHSVLSFTYPVGVSFSSHLELRVDHLPNFLSTFHPIYWTRPLCTSTVCRSVDPQVSQHPHSSPGRLSTFDRTVLRSKHLALILRLLIRLSSNRSPKISTAIDINEVCKLRSIDHAKESLSFDLRQAFDGRIGPTILGGPIISGVLLLLLIHRRSQSMHLSYSMSLGLIRNILPVILVLYIA